MRAESRGRIYEFAVRPIVPGSPPKPPSYVWQDTIYLYEVRGERVVERGGGSGGKEGGEKEPWEDAEKGTRWRSVKIRPHAETC